MIRTFFAIELAEANKLAIAGLLRVLQNHWLERSIHWVRPENIHITLQFLPAVRPEDVSRLLAEVETTTQGFRCPELTLGPLQIFPQANHPRVLVLDVMPAVELMALANLIGRGIQAAGYDIELRPFRGHLTLARLHNPHVGRRLNLEQIILPVFPKLAVPDIVYYHSEPQARGSNYKILGRVNLTTK